MSYKRLVNICGSKKDRKFVYVGEDVAFAFSDDYMKDEYQVRYGAVSEKGKDFIITYNNTSLGYEEQLYLEDVVTLYIEEDAGIRKYFNDIGKDNKEEEVEDKNKQ